MALKFTVTFCSLAVAAMAAAIVDECAAPPPSLDHVAISQQFAANESVEFNLAAAQATINIPTYVHVVARSSSAYISEQSIRSAVGGMNSHYAAHGFQFSIAGIDYTTNSNWATDQDQMGMKGTLRKGDYKTLNLYYISDVGGANGYCYFPTSGVRPGSSTLIQDGCTILSSTITNGQTMTHEVGHWFGLYHTFQNECNGAGDSVDDTPACKKSFSCDGNLDTCPGLPGKDPVNNFMSYGTCRRQFTSGQGARMRSSYNYYRA